MFYLDTPVVPQQLVEVLLYQLWVQPIHLYEYLEGL